MDHDAIQTILDEAFALKDEIEELQSELHDLASRIGGLTAALEDLHSLRLETITVVKLS